MCFCQEALLAFLKKAECKHYRHVLRNKGINGKDPLGKLLQLDAERLVSYGFPRFDAERLYLAILNHLEDNQDCDVEKLVVQHLQPPKPLPTPLPQLAQLVAHLEPIPEPIPEPAPIPLQVPTRAPTPPDSDAEPPFVDEKDEDAEFDDLDVMTVKLSQLRQTAEALGRGSFKEVRVCYFQRRKFALVTARNGRDFATDLKTEFDVIKDLAHPNIVRLHAYVTDNNHSGDRLFGCLADFCDSDLGTLLANQPHLVQSWSEDHKLELLLQLARALDYLHTANIPAVIHRDVKPGNIMLCFRRGTGCRHLVKLGDFGLAVENSSGLGVGATILGTGLNAGTVQYQAPEQRAADEKNGVKLSPMIDIYAWGGVATELLTLQAPWTGKTLRDILVAGPDPPPELDLVRRPAFIVPAVRRCFSPNPQDRQVASKLVRLLESREEQTRPETRPDPSPEPLQQPVPAVVPVPAVPAASRQVDNNQIERFMSILDNVVNDGQTRKRVFISYAWWPDREKNKSLQTRLKQLKKHLQLLHCDVFLDFTGDIVGNIEQKMAENMAKADHVLVVGTSHMKSRALDRSRNNLKIEHELAFERLQKLNQEQPDSKFVFCVPAEPGLPLTDQFPSCLGPRYGLDLAAVSSEFNLMDHTYVLLLLHLVRGFFPRRKNDIRFELAETGLRLENCLALHGRKHIEPSSSSDEELTRFCLSALAKDLYVQKTTDRTRGLNLIPRRCLLYCPDDRRQDSQTRADIKLKLTLLTEFLEAFGVELIPGNRPPPEDLGNNPQSLDKFVLVGTGSADNKAEANRLAELHGSILIPIILRGNLDTAFPGVDNVKKNIVLGFQSVLFKTAAVQDLVTYLTGWDADEQLWFNVAMFLYATRRNLRAGAVCEICQKLPVKVKSDLPTATPAVAVISQVSSQVGSQDQVAWSDMQSKIADLEQVDLQDFALLSSEELAQFISKANLPMRTTIQLRKLHDKYKKSS